MSAKTLFLDIFWKPEVIEKKKKKYEIPDIQLNKVALITWKLFKVSNILTARESIKPEREKIVFKTANPFDSVLNI